MVRNQDATGWLVLLELKQPLFNRVPSHFQSDGPHLSIEKLSLHFSKVFGAIACWIVEPDANDFVKVIPILLDWSSLGCAGFTRLRMVTLSKPIENPFVHHPESEYDRSGAN